jgi:alkylation response protein AidB-like acyl-CoA dehydrogenase
MDLEFTADQEELRDAVRAFLTAECPPALVRELVEARVAGKAAAADGLWRHMVALGWPALGVTAAAGGLGLGFLETAVVVEELGRVIAPGPLLPTISQFVPALSALGDNQQQRRFLGPVAAEGAAGTLAIAEESGSFDPAAVAVTATPTGDGGARLRGTKRAVMEAEAAAEIVVVAREPGSAGDDAVGAYVVPRDAVDVVPLPSLDASRIIATVTLDDVAVEADRVLGRPGPATAAALRGALREATVAVALESIGTAQQVFDISLEYAKTREQFGVPIGSFQATKHKFADLVILLERARALGYFAALTIAEGDERAPMATSMAKAAAADAAHRVAKEGIQVHGGIGYTWEHDMHLYVRRLQSSAALFGGAPHHRQLVADALGMTSPR